MLIKKKSVQFFLNINIDLIMPVNDGKAVLNQMGK